MCCALGGAYAEDQLRACRSAEQKEAGRDKMTCRRAPASQVSQWPFIPVISWAPNTPGYCVFYFDKGHCKTTA